MRNTDFTMCIEGSVVGSGFHKHVNVSISNVCYHLEFNVEHLPVLLFDGGRGVSWC